MKGVITIAGYGHALLGLGPALRGLEHLGLMCGAGGSAVALLVYRGMMLAASVYGGLVRAAFDLHRFALYEQLRWPLPRWVDGEALTEYLHRGTAAVSLTFRARDGVRR